VYGDTHIAYGHVGVWLVGSGSDGDGPWELRGDEGDVWPWGIHRWLGKDELVGRCDERGCEGYIELYSWVGEVQEVVDGIGYD